MPTSVEEIKQNKVLVADISVTPFDENSAGYLADALRQNTSVNNLNLSMSNITDDGFKEVAEVLLVRKINLLELNIDLTDITVASIDIIKDLITKKNEKESPKVKRLMIYRLEGIHENEKVMNELQTLADKNGVKIFFNNPLQREDNRLFANPYPAPVTTANLKNQAHEEERKESSPVTSKKK